MKSLNDIDINKTEEDNDDDYISKYINDKIKNIEDVEMSIDIMRKEIYDLDRVMEEKIENHVLKRNEYESKFENIKKKMKNINNLVENVDKEAEKGAKILSNLCCDIKRLDIGKQNVTQVILIFKRIAIIITSVIQLKKKARKREYKKCMYLVYIIKNMFLYINNLKNTNSENISNNINTLYNDINILFEELKQQIVEDINLIYDPDVHIEKNIIYLNDNNFEIKDKEKGKENDSKISINLFDACNCLYQLHPNYINNVVNKFVNFFLEKYILIFENNNNNTFETIDRRIAWLKRALNNYKNTYIYIFPDYYNIQFYFVSKFCFITKKHIIKMISYSMEEMNSVSLIQTVIKFINFENYLIKNIFFISPPDHLSLDNFDFIESPFPEIIYQILSQKKASTKLDSQACGNKQIDDTNQMNNLNENVKVDPKLIPHNNSPKKTHISSIGTKEMDIQGGVDNSAKFKNGEKSGEKNGKGGSDCGSDCGSGGHTFKRIISCVFDSYLSSWLKCEESKILAKYENIINEENNEINRNSKKEDDKIILEQFEKNEYNKIQNFINFINFINLDKCDNDDDNKSVNPNVSENKFENNFENILEGKNNIYKSAYKIFYIYKSYINMISQFTNCKTLFDFFIFFKRLLTKYSEELNNRIIEKIVLKNKINNLFLNSKIINTCYYIEQTMGEAYENMINIISPLFVKKIHFKEEEKLFLNIKTKSIKIIISFINDQIYQIIKTNLINIYDIRQLQKISPYIINLKNFLYKYFFFFSHILNETYLIYLLEKTASLIIDHFFQNIFSFNFMTNITAQQLLLDCNAIENILYKIPNVLTKFENLKINNEQINYNIIEELQSTNFTENDNNQSLIPKTYYNYIKQKINKIKFLIQIFISNTLDINSFNTLLAQNNNICTIHEIEKILSLKDDKYIHTQPNIYHSNNKYIDHFKKREINSAKEIKSLFNKLPPKAANKEVANSRSSE
ncbi:vacuolar protein sorting-associated protein 53, putative [Plasmodium yoelii]|uniref:Vacuolar protein sorting-associated protein 53 n=2 Tax=Plasmodium yoelii TaxID=5861 RepID=A0AAE9WLM3_PLAYO|nr:vacuolar protein sorting-associated protein 53, putative [Plasmodium yoelii]WBY54785.1 vacuolar protein sorting-associated protein 53 [Plasmodium yoelii yoelii]CDU16139.1 vacuolar protein sorting-associated protein 53, putative [Plasmodium yoelii]VTZ71764.1 vacuolar protein sorting-associated protein 53, putative [Plasmodium yoelii]|eukprot:XP_022811381.1 vacuolar protein sorting-associated protein 53, putative [Plasmodium yoelii]